VGHKVSEWNASIICYSRCKETNKKLEQRLGIWLTEALEKGYIYRKCENNNNNSNNINNDDDEQLSLLYSQHLA
jgi:hypothetical protein